MGRPDPHITGQGGQPPQRGILGTGELVGPLGGDQIGARGRAHQQGTTGEHPDLPVTVQQQKRQVLMGVPGCHQGT